MNAKYVLVKSYYGLGGDLCVLVGAMRFAKQTGREMVVDWNGGLYGRTPSGNLINEYFESPHYLTPSVLKDQSLDVFPPHWKPYLDAPPLTYAKDLDLTVSRPEEVPPDCHADCVVITRDSRRMTRCPEDFAATAQSLRPVERIRARVEAMMARMDRSRPSIGIHFRHGNGERKVIPPDPRWFRNRINARLRSLGLEPNQVSLLVATDCQGVLEYFARHYPNTFATEKVYRSNGAGAMHVGRTDLNDEQKLGLADEALVDMYALADCSYFIGSKGFFSLFVKLVRGKRHTLLYEGERLFNQYEFTDQFHPAVRDPLLGAALKRARQPLDGLFVRIEADRRNLYYYHDLVFSTSINDIQISVDELRTMTRAIIDRRTY